MSDMTPNQIRHSRIDEDTYECESCQDEFDEDGMCDHDGNIHTFCRDCCEEIWMPDERHNPIDRSDLD
jgi:hypothetical protein